MATTEHDLEILRPGTVVYVGCNRDVPARVLAAKIAMGGSVFYELGWWDGLTHQNVWLEETEFSTKDPDRETIGYK